ncbi:hypothetical protein ElyMa_001812300 [Elysia marginata]|uniref:Uncharacterized protein n=1 Tax=Elysia marginata TaxID=1093978 RepID=A0AAV4EHB9_9GAST|nr:hypothetical protein ElyMa_001812300 [Elysia marginata]
MEPKAAIPAVVMEWERRITKFYGDDASLARELEEVRRVWAAAPNLNADHRLDILLSNVGPTVKAELRCQPSYMQEDPEKVLKAVLKMMISFKK